MEDFVAKMGASNMDLVSILNSGVHLELKSEEEILDERKEYHFIETSCADSSCIDRKPKCGRVLISAAGEFTIVCDICNGHFDAVDSFSNHLKVSHSDYGVRDDGWTKITIAEEPACKSEEIEDEVYAKDSTTLNFAAHELSKDFNSKKFVINGTTNNVANQRKMKLSCSKVCSNVSREPTMILTATPIFDEKRLFCITCDSQLESKAAFYQHKVYHKEQLHKQRESHLNTESQGDEYELAVKDELDMGDYVIQDAVNDAANAETTNNDRDSEQIKSQSDYSFDSHYASDGCLQTSCDKMQSKISTSTSKDVTSETADSSATQLDLASPDEKTSFCKDKEQTRTLSGHEDETGHTRERKPNRLKRKTQETVYREKAGQVRIVFSENPEFDVKRNFCITCNRGFANKNSFSVHKHNHKIRFREKQSTPSEGTFSCELCSKQFESEYGLRQHIVLHHGDEIPTSLKDDPTYLQCRFCYKLFEKPTERYEHEKCHAGEKNPYQCPFCPRSFTQSNRRKIHELTHEKELSALARANNHVRNVESSMSSVAPVKLTDATNRYSHIIPCDCTKNIPRKPTLLNQKRIKVQSAASHSTVTWHYDIVSTEDAISVIPNCGK